MTVALDGERWLHAQQIFDRVIDLPAEQRLAALAIECADDELRQIVDGLIRADAQGAPEPAPAIATLGRLADPELPAGTRIGAFRIDRLLGAGGMGRVYLGSRADGRVEQRVAIKTIRGAFAGRDLLQRFNRERRILAKLNHPNIARFIDAFESVDGAPAFAMEYIAGTPLLEYAQEHRLDIAARLRLVVKIASAVDYAHRQLVVHRDLKPGNVLVDASGEPKLLDFGIAKSIQQHQEQALLDGQTAPESRYLSLRYAAPEQFAGETEGVSIDIYALGALLYELLTGRPPLQLDTQSLAAAQAQILNEMPRAPSEVAASDLPYANTRLRGDLDRIVLHALKKEPEQRYASASALVKDLQRVLEHRPISLRRSHRWYLLSRFLRRNALSTALAASVLAVLALSAVALYRQSIEVRQQRDEARAVTQFLVETFRSADPAYAGGQARVATLIRGAARTLESRIDIDPHTRNLLGLALAEASVGSGTPSSTASIDVLGIADDPALSVAERARANRIAAAITLAADNYDESERRVVAALRDEQDPTAIASLYDYQAKLKQRRGDYNGAVAVLNVADRDLSRRFSEDATVVLRIRLQRAVAIAIAGDLEAALALAQSVIARMRASRQPPVEIAAGLRSLAYLLSRLDRSQEVLPVAEELLAIVASEYGSNSVAYAGALMQKAVALANTGQWPAAVKLFESARTLMVNELGEDNLAVAKLEYSLAHGFLEENDAPAALPYIAHAAMVARSTWGNTHDDTIRFVLIQSRTLRSLQRHNDIIVLLEPLLEAYSHSKPDTLLRVWLQVDLAEALAQIGEIQRSTRLLHELDRHWTQHAASAAVLRKRADEVLARIGPINRSLPGD
jgi:serine/threonine-protein kinase